MKILANNGSGYRYPTWNVYMKLWKSYILPCIKDIVTITSIERSYDENRIITTMEPVTSKLLDNITDQISQSLKSRNFDVTQSRPGYLTIEGKNRDDYEPFITISIYESELDDDEIMEWDDLRWDDPLNSISFNSSYQNWLDSHNAVDSYDNIRRAPQNIKRLYCDWIRATQLDEEFCVDIMPVNM